MAETERPMEPTYTINEVTFNNGVTRYEVLRKLSPNWRPWVVHITLSLQQAHEYIDRQNGWKIKSERIVE